MKGFTLIELLVVISILALSLTATVGLFSQTFRSGSKTEQVVLVEENMRQSLDVMERMIRNAREIVDCSGSSLEIKNPDNDMSTFTLIDGKVASNGAALSADKVVVESLQFNCTDNTGAPNQVQIDIQARAQVKEEGDTVSYERTVDLRNY